MSCQQDAHKRYPLRILNSRGWKTPFFVPWGISLSWMGVCGKKRASYYLPIPPNSFFASKTTKNSHFRPNFVKRKSEKLPAGQAKSSIHSNWTFSRKVGEEGEGVFEQICLEWRTVGGWRESRQGNGVARTIYISCLRSHVRGKQFVLARRWRDRVHF